MHRVDFFVSPVQRSGGCAQLRNSPSCPARYNWISASRLWSCTLPDISQLSGTTAAAYVKQFVVAICVWTLKRGLNYWRASVFSQVFLGIIWGRREGRRPLFNTHPGAGRWENMAEGWHIPLNRLNIRFVPIDIVSFFFKRRIFSSKKSVFTTRNALRQLWRRRYQWQTERDKRLRQNKVCPGNRGHLSPSDRDEEGFVLQLD